MAVIQKKDKLVESNRKEMMKEHRSKTQLIQQKRDDILLKKRDSSRQLERTQIKFWRQDLADTEKRVNSKRQLLTSSAVSDT